MKIQPYVEKLNASPAYKTFEKKNTDAFMVAGFFILDLESGQNLHQLDYYIPSKRKVAAFTLDKQVTMQLMDMFHGKAPEKLDAKTNIDLESLSGILKDEMKNRSITEDIKKIIAILQNIKGKKIWNLNCILSGMSILNAHIEDSSGTVLKLEKKSFMDVMQKIPASALRAQQQQQQIPQSQSPESEQEQEIAVPTSTLPSKNAEDQIKKLDALEKAIQKEKEALQAESKNSKSTAKANKQSQTKSKKK